MQKECSKRFFSKKAQLTIFVIIAVVIVAAILVWQYIKKNGLITAKTIENTNLNDVKIQLENKCGTIAKELTETTEALKPFVPDEVRRAFFGQGPMPGIIRTIQSPQTREIVDRHREKITKAPSLPVDVHMLAGMTFKNGTVICPPKF